MKRTRFSLALFLVLGIVVCSSPSLAGYYGFDDVPATGFYFDVTPGGPRGPIVIGPGISLNGGVIMSDDGWGGLATSKPNLYGSSDYLPLADGSFLPGQIAFGHLKPGVFWSSCDLDVINGKDAAYFSLVAYGPAMEVVDSDLVTLAAFPDPGAVGHLSVSAPLIRTLFLYSGQDVGSADFAIDSINFTEAPVPVPSALLLLGSGLAGLAAFRRKLGR